MTNEEIVVKGVCGRRIIEEMMNDFLFRTLANRDRERFILIVQKILEDIPYEGKPETDELASDMIWRWNIRVRGGVLLAYSDEITYDLAKSRE